MTEILNCPFCGSTGASRAHEEMPDSFMAGCSDPDCIAHRAAFDFITEAAAISAWNHRAAPSPWRPDREAIVAEIWRVHDRLLKLDARHWFDMQTPGLFADAILSLSHPPSGGAKLEALKQAAREFYWANPAPLHRAARAYAAWVEQGMGG